MSEQRTEQPTQQRLNKARKEGRYPVSKEFVGGLQFFVVIMLAASGAGAWFNATRAALRNILSGAVHQEVTPQSAPRLLHEAVLPMALPLLWLAAALMAISLAAQLASTGMGLSFNRLSLDLKRLNPASHLKELPRRNLPALGYALILLPVFLAAVWVVVSDNIVLFARLPLFSPEVAVAKVGAVLEDLLWKAAGVFLVLGVVDLFLKRRRYQKDLRMSKQEIRDEMKESEGNPQVKGRIRRLQRDLLRRKMMSQVPKASAVVVNPTHFAVAIKYEPEAMAAPKVVAKGKNYLALRIRQVAVEHQVPIVENPPLAQALYKSVEVGEDIPVELYRAVAEVLAYIFRLMNRRM
ncbi:MAG: EscU/YscU/HrcU family type III secretion system export apparatus switch protein [Bryobacteraceae bacterium]|nr:EscU/YscU/HrcU family type III secretion system export apparatus switch protein [Bryobacteraceae bacterium]